MTSKLGRSMWAAVLLGMAATCAGAATIVLPPVDAAAEGNTSFGLGPQSFMFQQAYGSSLLAGLPVGSVINGFSVRLDASQTNQGTLSFTNFDVSIGKSNYAPDSLTASMAGNEGSDTVVARSGPLSFPSGSFPTGDTPNDFGPLINFTTPYVYTGGDLLLTLSISASDPVVPVLLDASSGIVGTRGLEEDGPNSPTTDDGEYALVTQFSYTAATTVPLPSSLKLGGVAVLTGLVYSSYRRKITQTGKGSVVGISM